jgi:hypothetical protein
MRAFLRAPHALLPLAPSRSAVSHTPRPIDLMQADAPPSIGADVATPASFVTPSPGASGAGSMPPPAALKLQGAARGMPVSAAADTTDPGELVTCITGVPPVLTEATRCRAVSDAGRTPAAEACRRRQTPQGVFLLARALGVRCAPLTLIRGIARSPAACSRMCRRSRCGAALGCLACLRVRWRCVRVL